MLHVARLDPLPSGAPNRWMTFLHGILGSGANWRTFAKRFVAARPGWGAALVDLRYHGQSGPETKPDTLPMAAGDVLAALDASGIATNGIVGHSFGGKVALEVMRQRPRSFQRAFIVDSVPGARPTGRGSESTLRIVELLKAMPSLGSRADFNAWAAAHGVDKPTTDWLAMNVRADDSGTFRFRVDLDGVSRLLEDYFARDSWDVIRDAAGDAASEVHLVAGGRSDAYDANSRTRAEQLVASHPKRVFFHMVEQAGHWVHVDAPDALLRILTDAT
jgi:esterase